MPLYLQMIKSILDAEDNSIRFENFCIDLFSLIEGVEFVPTSRSWDLARDGRTLSILFDKTRPYLCVTLEKDIDDKVKADIRRLSSTTDVKSIIYCTSQPVSEKGFADIESIIRTENPMIDSIQFAGRIQLATLAERHEVIFRKYYAAEINDIERALFTTPDTVPEAKIIGLKLALLAHESDDSMYLRKEIATRLVLDTLSNQEPKTPEQLAREITRTLHLPRTISNNYMRGIISVLKGDDLITQHDNHISLTEAGNTFISDIPETASRKLMEGRVAIRDAIQNLSGHVLTESQFSKLWNSFQDGITDLFHTRGLAIVKMIRSTLAEETWKTEKSGLEIPLDEFANRVVATITESQQREEVKQAIMDMFMEKNTPAFDWLTQICGIYVMMCTLGFETLSNEQVVNAISCHHLIPDSDVVLSLLCKGETNHEEVVSILSGWKAIGGKLYMVRPILEEVAHHAWISEYDYDAMGYRLSLMSDIEATRLLENAFVRAFRMESEGLTSRNNWEAYIKQYKGRTDTDYGPIAESLRSDNGWGLITEDKEKNEGLVKRVSGFLIKKQCDRYKCQPHELSPINKIKARVDGRLIATVHNERESARLAGESKTYCIISSARLLKEVDEAFRSELGEPEIVLSLSAIGFLLALIPQVQMGFGTLRSILFDTYLATRLTPLQRLACRVISTSGQWNMPWARRSILDRTLRQTLFDHAKLRGEPSEQTSTKFVQAKDKEFTTMIIAESLDKMAISPKTKEEINKLKKEKKEIEAQYEAEKAKPKLAIKKEPKTTVHFRRKKK